MDSCLSNSLIEQYHAGELSRAEADCARSHLASCTECCNRAAELLAANEAVFRQMGLLRRQPETTTVSVGGFLADAPTVASPDLPKEPPKVALPGYEILGQIGRGGQGTIFRARQFSTGQQVAIKLLSAGALASLGARRRFEREIELVTQLRHPNIISIFDSGVTSDGCQYYVMDFVQGESLREAVRSRKLAANEMLLLFVEICDAVSYAHQRGVIHRDLKPSNILIDKAGRPRILDFGLAKHLSAPDPLRSLTGEVLGTLPYMSPEQAKGRPSDVDVRSDVYSLGVVLYELLTGHYPYPVLGNTIEVLKCIAETPPTPPSRNWSRDHGVTPSPGRWRRKYACPIDRDVEVIVLKALAKEPARRYQSVGEFAGDIRHFLAGDPIEAKRDSAWYVLRKLARRHAYAATAVISLFVIAISAASISTYFYLETLETKKTKAKTDVKFQEFSNNYDEVSRKAMATLHELKQQELRPETQPDGSTEMENAHVESPR